MCNIYGPYAIMYYLAIKLLSVSLIHNRLCLISFCRLADDNCNIYRGCEKRSKIPAGNRVIVIEELALSLSSVA